MNFAFSGTKVRPQRARWTPRYDVSGKLWIGRRARQEDVLKVKFATDPGHAILVLADGMGGHTSGQVASKLVAGNVFGNLKADAPQLLAAEHHLPGYLKSAAERTNDGIRETVAQNPELSGMGSTLVGLVLSQDRLYWVSVGDSPLYRLRKGELTRLNQDHSMAAEIDFMVKNGLISPESGRDHPDRNCLKSAVTGLPMKLVDCPVQPMTVEAGDLYILASDGLQTLPDDRIRDIAWQQRGADAATIAVSLITAVMHENKPDQDNTSVAIIKTI
ncbi:PP2C family protein-serine/threonine phosphatase [Actibacterium sp. XHP0104]|uniref:PP2C family protein-serine/threonine phosphatase n=1 Tax=Actibacterium sp. XHP0104 TaxID=2984335 RepID=UPI0021E99A8B|nr:protein phosphatase 2C domain-containing protein [Actibacterium sp. XHP0104]MCV2880422.1 protein phosphatase 2C domain-containing protein [Actibacterium sp. XHP0104]